MNLYLLLVIEWLNTPVGAAVLTALLVVAVALAQRLPAWLRPLAIALINRFKPRATKPPEAPPEELPEALPVEEQPAQTGRPLVDLALKILAGVAARKFPHLTEVEAVERYFVEQIHYGYFDVDAAAKAAAEKAAEWKEWK